MQHSSSTICQTPQYQLRLALENMIQSWVNDRTTIFEDVSAANDYILVFCSSLITMIQQHDFIDNNNRLKSATSLVRFVTIAKDKIKKDFVHAPAFCSWMDKRFNTFLIHLKMLKQTEEAIVCLFNLQFVNNSPTSLSSSSSDVINIEDLEEEEIVIVPINKKTKKQNSPPSSSSVIIDLTN